MPKLTSRYATQIPRVTESGAQVPAHQLHITAGTDAYYTVPATPQFSSSLIGSGGQAYLDIERDEIAHIQDIAIRFRIKNTSSSADVQLVPPAYWFNRIVLEAEKGSGDELQHIYPEEMAAWFWLTMDEEERARWSHIGNFYVSKFKNESAERYWDSEKQKIKPGETKDVYIPIPSIFMHLQAIDMKFIRSDFRIRLEMSNDVVISGDKTNLSLLDTHLVTRSFAEENYDYVERMNSQQRQDHKYIYLDVERLQYNDKTLTAGANQRFALDQFVGKSPFLMCYIKPSTSPTASDRSKYKYVELGKEATIDIENSSAQSLLGQGTALKEDHIYKIFSDQTGQPHLKGVYMIPFCDDVKKSMSGVVNGFMDFVGVKDYLNIKFGDTGANEVQRIQVSELGVTGAYKYATDTNGLIQLTDNDYDDSTTDLASGLNDIQVIKDLGYTIDSVSSNFDASTTQDITFNIKDGSPKDEIGNLTIIQNGAFVPKVTSASLVTRGKVGWTTGSNYLVDIHMYKFKCLTVDTNGRISCKDL